MIQGLVLTSESTPYSCWLCLVSKGLSFPKGMFTLIAFEPARKSYWIGYKWSPPPNQGRGRLQSDLGAFMAIINTFGSLFKASDTFDDFQVLTKMADSHRNFQQY